MLRSRHQLTEADCFFLQEARRIKTPPLNPGTPDTSTSGILIDVSAPDETGFPLHSLHTSPELGGSPKLSAPLSRQWLEYDTKHANKGNKSTHSPARNLPPALMSPKTFELNLPEHLPSSPLCPKSPKHKSGGTGICVYHGRKKSIRLKHLKRASTGESNAPPTEE